MEYQLRAREPLAEGIRRVVTHHANAARRALTDPRSAGGLDGAIHEARKHLKRARSTLRVGRPLLGKRSTRRIDRRIRKAASLLSEPRDSAALVETFDVLSHHYASALRPHAFPEIRAHLVERYLGSRWRAIGDDVLARSARQLQRASAAMAAAEWTDDADGHVWASPVKRAYRRARRGMGTALAGRAASDFHEWRKQTMHLRHHLTFLAPAWAGHLDQASLLLHELTDLLGEHHDLGALREHLRSTPAARTTPTRRTETRAILALIEGRRREIEEDVEGTGRRLFERKPGEVRDRLLRLWEAWDDAL